jgi:serine/threonine protein kinase
VNENRPRTRYCSRCLTTFIGDLDRCPNLGCRTQRPVAGWGTLLEPGDTFDRHYHIEKRLAIGGAGVTYLGREEDAAGEQVGPWLAIKVLYAQRDQGSFLRRLSNEAQILQELDHPNIVQLMGFSHRKGHSPYLLTRFEEGGSLLDHLRRVGALPLKEAAAIGIQLCDALAVAHARGVIHRDLKPENVLLSKVPAAGEVPEVRVTDFGIAKVYGGVGGNLTKVGAFVGTPQYAAPEQFEGREPIPATDVYALGAVLYFLVTLRPVVPTADQLAPGQTLEILLNILPPRLELPEADPGELATFNAVLAATMSVDPFERRDLERVRELLDAVIFDRPELIRVETTDEVPRPGMDPTRTLEPIRPTPSEDTFQGILSRSDPAAAGQLVDLSSAPPTGAVPKTAHTEEPPPFVPPPELPAAPEVAPEPPEELELAPEPELPVVPPKKRRGRGLLIGAVVMFFLSVGLVGAVIGAGIAGIIDMSGILPDEWLAGATGGDDGGADAGADDGAADAGSSDGSNRPAPELELDGHKPPHQKDFRSIERSIKRQSRSLTCDLGDVTSFEVVLDITSGGDVYGAVASGLEADARGCVQAAMLDFTVPRTGTTASKDVRVRLSVYPK